MANKINNIERLRIILSLLPEDVSIKSIILLDKIKNELIELAVMCTEAESEINRLENATVVSTGLGDVWYNIPSGNLNLEQYMESVAADLTKKY